MDRRIEELVTATDAWCDQNFPLDWTDRVDEFLPLWNAKFAELLIKDCADCLDDGDMKGLWVRNVLYNRFGVE